MSRYFNVKNYILLPSLSQSKTPQVMGWGPFSVSEKNGLGTYVSAKKQTFTKVSLNYPETNSLSPGTRENCVHGLRELFHRTSRYFPPGKLRPSGIASATLTETYHVDVLSRQTHDLFRTFYSTQLYHKRKKKRHAREAETREFIKIILPFGPP